MISNMDNAAVIELLRKRQGGRKQTEVARELGVSPQYLHDVLSGNRKPSDRILEYVGLRWEIVRVRNGK